MLCSTSLYFSDLEFLASLPHKFLRKKDLLTLFFQKRQILRMEKKSYGLELQTDSEEMAATSEYHVLAVDDSIADRKVIERLLNISAYKVTTVESGRRALEFLGLDEDHNPANTHRLKFNMIITDYSMPGMTGYELLKKIKKSSALKDMPVVVMSSENVVARIDRCLEEGAEEFIVKPVKLSDVNRFKGHIVKGLPKKKHQQQSTAAKRKFMAENIADLPEQPSKSRSKLEEQAVF